MACIEAGKTQRQTDIHTEAERGHEETSDYRRTT